MLLMDFLGIHEAIMGLLLKIDGVLYNFICWFYEIFLALTKIRLFTNADYESIVRRIYIILGVIMLFVLSYSLLRAIVNPDEFSKGDKSFPNIIKNVVVSLVIIVLLPTVFEIAFRVQAVILNSDVIGKIILNENVDSGSVTDGGRTIATNVFRAFFYVNEDAQDGDHSGEYNEIAGGIASAFDEVSRGNTFQIFSSRKYNSYYGGEVNFPELVADNAIEYTWPLSTIAGAFVLWCILLFCFDLGIRAIKLVYYQMIAPIAVVCRVIPGNKTKDVFPNWVKATVATFMEVFIRILIMYLGVYLITLLVDKFPDINAAGSNMGLSAVQRVLLKAFLIMGIVAFIRQAPKLIQNVFGFDTGGMNLGLKGLTERLSNGGGFAAGALVGAAGTNMLRNLTHSVQNIKNAKGNRWKAFGKEILKTPRGLMYSARAGLSGAYGAFNAKSIKEAKDATGKAVKKMTDKRDEAERYKASHPGFLGSTRGHIADNSIRLASWAGWDNVASLQEANSRITEINKSKSSIVDEVRAKVQSDIQKRKTGSYGLSGPALENIRGIREAAEVALNNGTISEQQYTASLDHANELENDLVNAIVDKVTSGRRDFEAWDPKYQASFSSARQAQDTFRQLVINYGANEEYFKKAGLSVEDFDAEKGLDMTSDKNKIDAMESYAKIQYTDNQRKAQRIREAEQPKDQK